MMLDMLNLELLNATLRLSTPLLLAALGALIVWRAGIINIAVEGYILVGAMAATLATIATGSLLAGVVAAIGVSVAFGAAIAVAIVVSGANQIVIGIAFNIGAIGLTNYLAAVGPQMLGVSSLRTATIESLPVPVLSDLPILGPVVFSQSYLFYLGVLASIVAWVVLGRTGGGVTIRAVGEHARAATAAGINVARVRFATYLVSAAFAGLAGAFLSIGNLGTFTPNISAGQGYIALVVVILGQWHSIATLFAALLFGLAQTLVVRWPSSGSPVPIEFVIALPYLLTLAIVSLVSKAKGPAEEGIHHVAPR